MPPGIEFPPETRQQFIAALEQIGKVTGPDGAAEVVGVSVPILYKWRKDDLEFAAAWDEAKLLRRELLAEQGWNVVAEILADEFHKDRLAAAKVAIERADTSAARNEGADADGIAQAIDRFTSLVAHAIAVRAVREPSSLRAAIASGAPLREGES